MKSLVTENVNPRFATIMTHRKGFGFEKKIKIHIFLRKIVNFTDIEVGIGPHEIVITSLYKNT